MIKVVITETGSVEVKYYPTHNHVLQVADLKHQPLNDATNSYIDKHIALGASPRKILKTLRGDKFARVNRNSSQKLTRNDFINLKTLRERKRLMVAAKSLSANDAEAVKMLFERLVEEEYNPVLIYKPYKAELQHGPQSAINLPQEVFMLGLQSKEQADMMRMASQTILIVDATHDMDQYGCKLLNVVGVDELNRGYPLAHLISSKMDEHTLKYFFEALRLRLPDLEINCVITDDDPALINSMNMGFQELIRHILCDWHFKRTMQAQLHSKVKETELEDQMFKELCVIIDLPQESEFKLTLKAFINKYENGKKTKSFVDYFKTYCLKKRMQWAKCYRRFPHGNVETTMYVESFHNILKTIYLKRKPNKRIETLVNLLLEVEEDYYTRRQTTICTVAPREQYFQYISERHLKGVNIPCDDVQEYDENGSKYWIIESQSIPGVQYKVFRNSDTCTQPGMCFFQCHATDCHDNLCAHMYMCTCPDDILLCKHIHKVHSKFYTSQDNNLFLSDEVQFHYNEEEQTSTTTTVNIRQEKEEADLLKSLEELADHIKHDSVKQLLYPYLRSNMAGMLAQCRSVVNQADRETTLPEMTATVQHSSREKLKCQVPAFQKKKMSKKTLRKQMSRAPKLQERADIKTALLSAAASSTTSDSVDPVSSSVSVVKKSPNIYGPEVQFVPRPIFVPGKPSTLRDKHNIQIE
ncbi:Methionyl-tRNA formyltransferase [Frankliniella fusca]|uniref:Methionyl-tRNA formyltransferase n=1 Tax=Frankliniella fusca TaxID=407009 RepID=A0AAE1HNC4_9NEOP|nr:Methionyl-tRNA formyltransferase [Frankliniella fusca]